MTDAASTPDTRVGFATHAAIVALLGVVLALAGAFGTGGLPLPARLAYWIGGLVGAGMLMQLLVIPMRGVCRMLAVGEHWAYLMALPLLCAGFLVAFWLTAPPTVLEGDVRFGLLFVQTLAVGVAIFLLFGGLFALSAARTGDTGTLAAPPATTPPVPSFEHPSLPVDTKLHERLPPAFGPVLALRVEDHYTIAIGHGGQEMLLLPLRDAIAEIGETHGEQVHRSWWVAHGAVAQARRSGRSVELELVDGSVAPVSRANVAEIRKAGWLAD
ncbi:LytTR family transcriptional regulator DNA-binding domain-containing protein [Erythrobacteraceae bacterium WH01K]|nr:LytTR family transcriptional regulator DNA-binding domain-containing protein [Erythrobacteraceae bacterium WH01K]